MKIKKICFADIENILSKEEAKGIIGGTTFIPDMEYGEEAVGGGYSGIFGVTGFGQGPFVSGSAGLFGSVSTSSGGSINFGSSSSWTETGNGFTTSDPVAIARLLDFLDWENTVLHNNPSGTQIANFLNQDFSTGGRGTLSDGSTLAQSMTMYQFGGQLQLTNNPYEAFVAPSNLVNVFQNMGDSLITGGFVLSSTGVGAVVGIPLMELGGIISGIGTVGELYLDLNSNEPFDYTKWIVKGGLELVPNIYENLFSVRVGVVGYDQALVEMYATTSDHWFDFMRELHNP